MLSLALLAQHPRGLDIGGALVVGAMEQADGAEQDGLGGLDGGPALGSGLVAVLVLLGWVQDRYAQLAALVDVGVERDRVLEGERGGHVRVAGWEDEASAEVASWREELALGHVGLFAADHGAAPP